MQGLEKQPASESRSVRRDRRKRGFFREEEWRVGCEGYVTHSLKLNKLLRRRLSQAEGAAQDTGCSKQTQNAFIQHLMDAL